MFGKCYQPRPSAQLITLTETLIIRDISKTSSNNCFIHFVHFIFAFNKKFNNSIQKYIKDNIRTIFQLNYFKDQMW